MNDEMMLAILWFIKRTSVLWFILWINGSKKKECYWAPSNLSV
jgi:hypothetical protein